MLDRATGKVVKARNVVFEEGSGHRTLFDQQALHDEPIFDDEVINDTAAAQPSTHVPANVDIPSVEIPQAPVLPNTAGIIRPQYPIAPRQQPIPPATPPIQRPCNVQLFNIQQPAHAEPPGQPRRSTRVVSDESPRHPNQDQLPAGVRMSRFPAPPTELRSPGPSPPDKRRSPLTLGR